MTTIWHLRFRRQLDQKSSNGFIDIYGLPSRVAAARDVKFGNGIEVPENSVE